MKIQPATFAAAALALGTGFTIGKLTSARNAADAETSATAVTKLVRPGATGSSASATGNLPELGNRPRSATHVETSDRLDRLRAIALDEDPLRRGAAWLEYVNSLGPDEFADALAAFRELGMTGQRRGEYELLLSAWAKIDPLAALADATENTRGPRASQTILATWAATDPEGALRWAEENHDGDGANPLLIGVIRGLAAHDFPRASEIMNTLPFSRERGQAVDALLPHLFKDGPEAAKLWVESLDDSQLKAGVVQRMVDRLAATDSEGTARWVAAQTPEVANRSIDDAIGQWASENRNGAISWYQSLPKGEIRSNALRGIVNELASDDPATAATFMESHSADVTQDVVQQFIWNSFRQDPSIAVSYIGRIEDERRRDRFYRRTLGTWMNRDPEAARTWIQSNSVPDHIRERFLNQEG